MPLSLPSACKRLLLRFSTCGKMRAAVPRRRRSLAETRMLFELRLDLVLASQEYGSRARATFPTLLSLAIGGAIGQFGVGESVSAALAGDGGGGDDGEFHSPGDRLWVVWEFAGRVVVAGRFQCGAAADHVDSFVAAAFVDAGIVHVCGECAFVVVGREYREVVLCRGVLAGVVGRDCDQHRFVCGEWIDWEASEASRCFGTTAVAEEAAAG